MSEYDLVIKGGTVVTGVDVIKCKVGVNGEQIAAIGTNLPGARTIGASGLLVMPDGVDSHCHIEQLEPDGFIHE
ncbi:hypothetical protein [Breoghania sp.]|uniref:hypothetical protein n=1 Tax=Breoghania sp. TaxID=2065378 RepID=UPI00261C0936|nr:hypothetical protein [Breoghania sp.]MDJ0930658.1 hypothetical protein [Breoghania sp.]